MRHILRILALALVYQVLTDPASPVNFLLGMALALATPALAPSEVKPDWRQLPRFLAGVVRQIAASSVTTLGILVTRRGQEKPGFLELSVVRRSATGAAVSALAVTSMPGTVAVDLDLSAGTMTLHAIDVAREDRQGAAEQDFYHAWQRPMLP